MLDVRSWVSVLESDFEGGVILLLDNKSVEISVLIKNFVIIILGVVKGVVLIVDN